ncbi:hypothetical protein O181_030230 [Austropuccinia psidii MF-1]|uniref:Uncharacterized protein n=1 Tax=Austropuccinia psidii MF-1 TaxID=1389203 RepID=A0A9Q3CVW7_9BASI|nr:hypothetical protein [Austropuccinia psidii MF-1]
MRTIVIFTEKENNTKQKNPINPRFKDLTKIRDQAERVLMETPVTPPVSTIMDIITPQYKSESTLFFQKGIQGEKYEHNIIHNYGPSLQNTKYLERKIHNERETGSKL